MLAFWPFVGAVLVQITQGTWRMILVSLHLKPNIRPGLVTVPFEARTKTGVAVSTLVNTLSPGSVLLDIDWEHRLMRFHYINSSDPVKLRQNMQTFYQKYQRKVFP